MPPGLTIRLFDPKRDYPAFQQLNFRTFWHSLEGPKSDAMREMFTKHYENLLRHYAPHDPDKALVTVAELPGVPYAAHCWTGVQQDFFTNRPTAWVFDLSVVDEYQAKGIGKALLDDLVTRCRNIGFPAICLQVMVHNERAREFYRREGFAPRAETLVLEL